MAGMQADWGGAGSPVFSPFQNANDDGVDMEGSQTDETGDDEVSNDASMVSAESLEHSLMFQLRHSPSSFRQPSPQNSGGWA